MITARRVMSAALAVYCSGLFVAAATPTDDIDWLEWVVIVASAAAIIGLVAHLVDAVTLPGEQYAYLVAGFAGLVTFVFYLIDTTDPSYVRARLALLIGAGMIAAYGAHLTTGQTDEKETGDG